MLFNSLQFLFFFPTVVALYYALPRSWRLPLLLLTSCVFYMVFIPSYILILFALILVDYGIALILENQLDGPKRIAWLNVSILSNLGLLFLFKYFNFAERNIYLLMDTLHLSHGSQELSWILPIGLSFHTFQSLSYTIEVYYRRQKAETNLGIYALYVLFFPQMVAGPIERPQNLLPQFNCALIQPQGAHAFDGAPVVEGLKRMLWGFFKKIVIADRLAVFVDYVYGNPQTLKGFPLVLATVFFAFQIYCDFSGYTDIAIGAAQVLGFNLMKNFNRPYSARSVSDFWHRWHISLSTWFRDYLYIPLGGNQGSAYKTYANLLTVFVLSGLWHGAKGTFLVWGALHGLFLMSSRATKNWRRANLPQTLQRHPVLHHGLQRIFIFALVSFAWIFFRADSLNDGLYIAKSIFSGWSTNPTYLYGQISALGLTGGELGLSLILIVFLQVAEGLQFRNGSLDLFGKCFLVVAMVLQLPADPHRYISGQIYR